MANHYGSAAPAQAASAPGTTGAQRPAAQQYSGYGNVPPTIAMRHVSLVYPAQPDKPALDDVSLDIMPGDFVFLVGHSGSGKSTFIKTIIRQLKPTSGHIYVAGQDLSRLRDRKVPFLRRQIGCVFQDYKLLPNRTAYENVAFALESIGKSKSVIKVQVPEVLRLVGLEEKMDKLPDQLSGGEQQRVALARLTLQDPAYVFADEPTGNLDAANRDLVLGRLAALNAAGKTVVVVTHDPAVANAACVTQRVEL